MLDESVIPGVSKLNKSEIEALIHDEDGIFGNFAAMPSGLNSSKQDKLFNWSEYRGQPLNPTYMKNLVEQQNAIVKQMQKWVSLQVKGR